MKSGIQYSRTPIVEAILDVGVVLPGGFDVSSLAKCQQKVKRDYPDRSQAQSFTGEFAFGEKAQATASSEQAGYFFTSADKKQLFQAKRSGFTYNRLAPYPGWDAFFAEAKRLWEEYRRVARPQGYTRLGLRYVDRFEFAADEDVRLETYFRTYPEVSRDLPQVMRGFFFQFQLPLREPDAIATITQTVGPKTEAGENTIILDIDLFRTENLPAGGEIFAAFETLREWKNKVFEACITDAMKELLR